VKQPDVGEARGVRGHQEQNPMDASSGWQGMPRGTTATATTGWRPTCRCDAGEPVPAVVLDPFAGSGTVCQVSTDLGRRSIGIELNPEYVSQARERNAQLGLML